MILCLKLPRFSKLPTQRWFPSGNACRTAPCMDNSGNGRSFGPASELTVLCRLLNFVLGGAPTVTNANAACHQLWGWHKRCRPIGCSTGIPRVRSLLCYHFAEFNLQQIWNSNSCWHRGSGQPKSRSECGAHTRAVTLRCSHLEPLQLCEYSQGFQPASEQSLLVQSCIICYTLGYSMIS